MLLARRSTAALVLPILFVAASGCDIARAHFNAEESVEWRKTYELAPGGRVEIRNVNGRIDVRPSDGRTVEIVAVKTARGRSADQARETASRIQISEDISPSAIRVETKLPRSSGFFNMNSGEVRYTVRVPAASEATFVTVNGGLEITGLTGPVRAETTNGGIVGRDMGGAVDAETTNGGIEIDLARVAEGGVKLECTNGGISLRLPEDSKATVSANITNGGIDTGGLQFETTETSRHRLEARLNGGGPSIRLSGTNGGIHLKRRLR
jgi:hypothetical protein